MIWVPSELEAWEPAQLVSSDAKYTTARLRNGKETKFPGPVAKFDPIPAGSLDEGCENLVNLESFCEGIILHHVKKRYYQNTIYTFVGNILVALNPYRALDIYGPAMIDKIYELTKYNETVPPHVYSIGAAAVHHLRHDLKDQSVLISGESGAGKTEATKKILQFISTVSGSTASRTGHSIENQILDSNPLLESFGNAKTIRNNNSSRFGKYMEVNFDKKNNIKGCNIVSYLLEKSRVVKQGLNERNYHVFYMLLAGAKQSMKKDFALKPPDQFWYLGQSGCFEVDRRSDVLEFEEMIVAMSNLSITEAVQAQIFQCLAGILHLGNLTFVPSREVENGSKAASPGDCRRVANLLGINPDALERALCTRVTTVNGESTSTPLPPEKAVDLRDALAKFVYGKLFDYIVQLVNSSLFRGKVACNIGVLDIFGFEVFKVNSFEQLCINYCNERLQTFFNEVIFESEIKTYQAEDLPIDDITFVDNMGCVRLIDQRGAGIFAYLDEEVTVPKGSDTKFVSKINQVFDEAANTKSAYFGRNRRSPLEFTVKHFAGAVGYNATDFLEKNRDALAEALMEQMKTSTMEFLHMPEPNSAAAGAASGGGGGGAKSKKNAKATLSSKFKSDLDSLMNNLRQTAPHFVRCVKPNEKQTPNLFESMLTLNQLKYSGLFEAIRIRKAGYAVRIPVESFVQRFKHCCLNIPAEEKADPKAHALALLTDLGQRIAELPAATTSGKGTTGSTAAKLLNSSEAGASVKPGEEMNGKRLWVIGKTKIFIRTQAYKYQLEQLREQSATNLAIPIQKMVRGFIMRCRYLRKMGDKRKASEAVRKREAEERRRMRIEDALSVKVEDQFRNDFALQKRLAEAKRARAEAERQRLEKLHRESVLQIQRIVRGHLQRTAGRIFMCEKMLEQALAHRAEAELRRALVLPGLFRVSSKLIRVYQHNAKTLILAMLNESYVINQLSEAIQINSTELLKDAVKLAEESNMLYLPEVSTAYTLLENSSMLRTVLGTMSSVLSRCVSVPKLLLRTDLLELLVMQATRLGLAGEPQIQDCVGRLHRVKNLIALRDRMRFSLEVCSPSKMQAAMLERAKLVRIYGPELLAEEAGGIENMFRMLNFQAAVNPDNLTAVVPGSTSGKELNEESLREASSQAQSSQGEEVAGRTLNSKVDDEGHSEHGGTQLSAVSSTASKSRARALSIKLDRGAGYEFGSVYGAGDPMDTSAGKNSGMLLPLFVTRCLERLRDAHSPSEINAAEHNFVTVVPTESKRHFYTRVFKWVVSFATWKYPKRLSNEAISAAKMHSLNMDTQTDAYTLLLVADTVGEVSSVHPLLSVEAAEMDKRLQQQAQVQLELARQDTTSSFSPIKHPSGRHGTQGDGSKGGSRGIDISGAASSAFSPGSVMRNTVRFTDSPESVERTSPNSWAYMDSFRMSGGTASPSQAITGTGMSPNSVPASNRTSPLIKSHTFYISPGEVQKMQVELKQRGTDSPRVMKKMSAMRARALMNAGTMPEASNSAWLSPGSTILSGSSTPAAASMTLSASGAAGAARVIGTRSGSPFGHDSHRKRANSPTGGRLQQAFFNTMDQSNSTHMANGAGGGNNYRGPYAQRQSKSAVAASHMIKKGKKINFDYMQNKTDKIVCNSAKELANFVNKQIKPPSTF